MQASQESGDTPRGGPGAEGGGERGREHAPQETEPPGRPRVPGWTVGRRLGAGADAEVWEVRGPGGEQAALKVPLPGGAEGLAQEAAALRHHRHRHLVAPLGEVETDRGTGLLTELLAGGSLAALVRAGGPLPVARMRTAVVPIAQALQSLHEEGIVHGDVSPANILFDVDGRPALSDLGASRLLGGQDRAGGTPGFAAPETVDGAHGDGAPGAAADVFALGAVAWFCLTGRAPAGFDDRAPLPVLVPDAGAELADLLDACLDPVPEHRPSAEEFAHALYATGECEPVLLHASASSEVALVLPTVRPAPTAPGRSGRARPSRRRGRMLPAAGGLAAAAAAMTTALMLFAPADTHDLREQGGTEPTRPRQAAAATDSTATADPRQRPSGGQGDAPPSGGQGDAPPSGAGPDTAASQTAGTDGRRPEADPALPDAHVLERVATERARALAHADAAAVAAYAVPDSDAGMADRTVIERLRAEDTRFDGLELSVTPDGEADAGSGQRPTVAAVPVVLETSAHRLVDGNGEVLTAEVARRDAATLVMERTEDGWKVSEVRPR